MIEKYEFNKRTDDLNKTNIIHNVSCDICGRNISEPGRHICTNCCKDLYNMINWFQYNSTTKGDFYA